MAENEYIERESLLDEIEHTKLSCFYLLDEHLAEMFWKITSKIENHPAADVRPVVRGKWISDYPGKNLGEEVRLDKDGCPENSCYCSVCGEWLTASDEYQVKGNFCPNCGADMREE